jgi:hypothetical protein
MDLDPHPTKEPPHTGGDVAAIPCGLCFAQQVAFMGNVPIKGIIMGTLGLCHLG